jgi:hypothetical protein
LVLLQFAKNRATRKRSGRSIEIKVAQAVVKVAAEEQGAAVEVQQPVVDWAALAEV